MSSKEMKQALTSADVPIVIALSEEKFFSIIKDAIEAGIKNSPYYSQSNDDSGLMTREEAANYLGITPVTLTKYVRIGLIENGGTKRKYRFKKSDLNEYLFKAKTK